MLLKNVNNKYECAICHRPYGDVIGLSTYARIYDCGQYRYVWKRGEWGE